VHLTLGFDRIAQRCAPQDAWIRQGKAGHLADLLERLRALVSLERRFPTFVFWSEQRCVHGFQQSAMASSSAEPAPPATIQDTQLSPEFDVPEVNIEAESLEVGVSFDLCGKG
jgi:hypothetical protein